MSEKPDMDVKNYSIEDLLKIFDIDIPVDQEELLERGKDLINKYINEDQQEAAAFYTKALQRLLENFKEVEDFFESKNKKEQFGENILKNQYYNDGSVLQQIANIIPNRQNNTTLISDDHPTQAQGRLISQNVNEPTVTQGHINPILKNKYVSWVNIDSHYREIRRGIDSTSCNFNDTGLPESHVIAVLDSSTEYTLHLSEPLTNVTALTLKSMEIPMNAYHPVSEKYGTNAFDVIDLSSKTTTCISIPAGFYPAFSTTGDIWDISGTLVLRINQQINSKLKANAIEISINPNTQRATFTNTSIDISYNIIFYSENVLSCSSQKCQSNNSGARIDSNLGWLLGFRQPQYTLYPKGSTNLIGKSTDVIISEHIVNPWGTRYLLLEVDDLNRNRASGNLISMSNNKDKLKLPEYYEKSQGNFPVCSTDISGSVIVSGNAPGLQRRQNTKIKIIEKKRPYRTGTPATTPLIEGDNLTKAQKYTITEIVNRRKTQDQSRYHSPVNTNILFRTPVKRMSTDTMTGNETAMIVSNDMGFEIARQYFGPVTIKTLKIKLLNDKGYPIELNDDWSFSLMVERLYQY